MKSNKEIGKIGEDIAVKYLKKKKYRILGRNFEERIGSLKMGEIDIIAKKENLVIFCEVKTLSSEKGFSPEDKVNFKKRETIAKVAEIWLTKHNISLDSQWQIDVVSIVLDFNNRQAKIKHFKNI